MASLQSLHRFSLLTFMALPGLMLHACSQAGPEPRAEPKHPPPSVTSIPTYEASRLKDSLLSPQDIDKKLQNRPLGTPALKDRAIPSCSLSQIKLPGRPATIAREFSNPENRYTGANYGQLSAVYATSTAASAAFDALKSKVRSCPKEQRVPAKRLPNGHSTIQHEDTWKLSEGQLLGWAHIRGNETDIYPKSSSIYNIFHIVYDYSFRGNVILASMYWERVKPDVKEDRISGRATELLTKQLNKIGQP